MAKSNNIIKKPNKGGFQGGRIENKVYRMECRNCDWKSDPSTFRSSLTFAGDMHNRFTRDIKTGKTHRVEMVRVED